MPMLHGHLTEDELLALRDRRGGEPEHLQHVKDCPHCQERLVFLRAFKLALSKLGRDEETVPPSAREAGHHPDPNDLAAYLDDLLAREDLVRVKSHLDHCERCRGDVTVLRLFLRFEP